MSDRFVHPLVERNASDDMIRLWSPQTKFSTWRRLWVALAEAQAELGLAQVTPAAVAAMRAAVDDVDFARAAAHERRVRHDVMAHIHTFEEAAPAAKGLVHLGATSAFVTDNADLLLLRRGLDLLIGRLVNVIDALGRFAGRWRDLPALGYTHFQPAQPVTVGKRATLWCQDFVFDLHELQHRLDGLEFQGVKGTTGTQASFLALFDGDHAKVRALEARVAEKMGFRRCIPVTGQTYPRKIDSLVVNALAGIAQSAHKMCNDIRLLSAVKEMDEPAEAEQVGSSAMAYKRNPMRCERATGLARYLIALSAPVMQTTAEQWLERTLDDSSNRRMTLPEAFLAADGILLILQNVAGGLTVYPKTVERRLAEELPFMATEEILMAGVRAGGDRQQLHERIRQHSWAAAEQVKQHGRPNDLVARLKADPAFAAVDIDAALDPKRHVGRSAEQVDEFLTEVVAPIRTRYAERLGMTAELKV
jgi:adenylosuccinate lyase